MQEQTLKINRITPDQVKAAYESTGLKPEQCIWIDTSTGRNCACGLSAVYAARFDAKDLVYDGSIFDVIADGLCLQDSYVSGFVAGFDHGGAADSANLTPEVFKLGYEDGVAAWEAVKHLAGAHG